MVSNQSSLLLTLEYPPDLGGIATYYYHLKLQNSQLSVYHLKNTRIPLSWICFLLPVIKKIKIENYGFIQIGHILPLGYLGLIIKILYKKPYCVYIHGLDVLQKSLTDWKKIWIKKILSRADHIIANSNYTKQRVADKYKIAPDKIEIKYPKIDLISIEHEQSKLNKSILKQNDTIHKILLSVGRLVERKGFDKVIEALSQVQYDRWRYWIVGDGPDKNRLKALIEYYNLENQIQLFGSIPTPKIYEYYDACDIFIMPSREINGDVEGFGIVFLEAAAFKKAVIGSRSGGIPEAVLNGRTGLIVDPLNATEISNAIDKLLSDEQLAHEMGRLGYERLKLEFSV